jgi:hypothetical protein
VAQNDGINTYYFYKLIPDCERVATLNDYEQSFVAFGSFYVNFYWELVGTIFLFLAATNSNYVYLTWFLPLTLNWKWNMVNLKTRPKKTSKGQGGLMFTHTPL